MHQLWYLSGVVPPMDVEQIDVACLQLLERRLDRQLQTFGSVADVVALKALRLVGHPSAGEFGG